MSTRLEEAPTLESVRGNGSREPAAEVDPRRRARLLRAAGELVGQRVLAVGCAATARGALDAGAAVVDVVGLAGDVPGATCLDGELASLHAVEPGARYDTILIAAGLEDVADPLPEIAAACALGGRIVAYFPRARRGWLSRSKGSEDDGHEPDHVKRLFELAGARSLRRHRAPGGFVIRARVG